MSAGVALGALAEVWVKQWLEHGGSLIAYRDADRLQIGMRMYDGAGWRTKTKVLHDQRWYEGWIVGRWRQLSDLVGVVPGLQAALVQYVRAHGQPYTDGAVAMYGPDPAEAI